LITRSDALLSARDHEVNPVIDHGMAPSVVFVTPELVAPVATGAGGLPVSAMRSV
jgi:hypothetical protein